MGKTVKSVATRVVDIATCISRAILKWGLGEISELNYFSEDMRRN